jgi:hypothetical protein
MDKFSPLSFPVAKKTATDTRVFVTGKAHRAPKQHKEQARIIVKQFITS